MSDVDLEEFAPVTIDEDRWVGGGSVNGVVIVWRKRDRELRRRLRAGVNFDGADLRRAKLVDMDLRSKSFRGANAEFADLTEADLRGSDLRGANLRGAYLTGAMLQGADLRDAVLRDAWLLATHLEDTQLADADVTGAVYDQATVWPAGYSPPRP